MTPTMKPARHAFLVEDNPVIRANLIPTLEELADITVIGTAEGKREAVAWLAQRHAATDVIVLHLMLSNGFGIGVLRKILDLQIAIPVIVLTNYATTDIRERCMALGALALFDKSTELEDFFAFCNRAMHGLGRDRLH